MLRDFIAGADGRRFLATCERLGIAVEYEMHAMGELLSRELYYKDPHITTFATYIDADYVKLHGDPQPALKKRDVRLKEPAKADAPK